jgi:hypothetical protein
MISVLTIAFKANINNNQAFCTHAQQPEGRALSRRSLGGSVSAPPSTNQPVHKDTSEDAQKNPAKSKPRGAESKKIEGKTEVCACLFAM